jgi:hypothetical protein
LLKDYYTMAVEPNTTVYNSGTFSDYFNGLRMRGLAAVVEAQWEEECFNLTLKNRDVMYDQDFYAKNNLTVDPADNTYDPANPKSFADPVIETPDFIIEPGKTVNMVAGNSIHLKPGFHARAGCSFHASIDPSLCTAGLVAKSAVNNSKPENKVKPEPPTLKELSENFSVFPNPNNGHFTVSSSAMIQGIEITNLVGNIIYKSDAVSSNSTELDLSTFPKGYYILRGATQNKTYSEKLVIQ